MKFNVKDIKFPSNQYFAETQVKKQIVLHHTVSDPMSATGDINSWLSDTTRIATYIILGYDGTIHKCFKSNEWAHHLGVTSTSLKNLGFKDSATRNLLLNKQSIGIEIDAWGGLTKKDGVYYNAYGRPISNKLDVVECNWRGFKYFQKYSKEQIDVLSRLLPILMREYNIANNGIKDGNLNVRMDALRGESGIYSHTSYRSDKSDIYPDEDLLKMLKTL